VSNDAKTVTQLVYEHKSEYYTYFELRDLDTEKMTIIDLPVAHYPGYEDFSSSNYTDFLYEVDNSDCLQHVGSMEWRWIDYSWNTDTIVGKDKIKNFWSPIRITFSKP
jgi:hypothetical protein